MIRSLAFALVSCCVCQLAHSATVTVAVAANFAAPMKEIGAAFEADTGHKAVLATGSTGKFYAQIVQGAPFQVLLAADATTPARLEKEGWGVKGTRFTYATGRLVLWSRQATLVDRQGAVLRTGRFEKIALADSRLAPYGAAAMETLTRLGLLEQLQAKFVQGESIAQAYQFVATGNAALGFVALSQVFAGDRIQQGSAWVVPSHLHTPLRHDALLLRGGEGNAAALALLNYLRGEKARHLIQSFGYAP